MRHRNTCRFLLLLSLPLLFLALFYFYPLGKILHLSFSSEHGWQPTSFHTLLTSPAYGRIIWFTIWQAALSTILTIVLALPGAYVFAKYTFPGKNLLQALTTVPFVLPTVVTAASFRALLGNNGLVNRLGATVFHLQEPLVSIEQTLFFFLLAHVFYNYALILRMVGSYWAGLEPDLLAAAQMLGASPTVVFRRITLPLLLPAIGSAAILVFIFCFTSFGIILILGGPGYATIEVEIYRQAIQLFNLPKAATLSLVQIMITFLFMWSHAQLSQKSKLNFISGGAMHSGQKIPSGRAKLFAGANFVFMTALLLTPLLALLLSSVSGPDGFTLSYYRTLLAGDNNSLFYVPPYEAIRNSIGFALLAMLLALSLGLLAAMALTRESGRLAAIWDAILMLPLATSAVTLGFGFIVALNKPPLNLRDSFALVPLAHTLVAFPFVLRCLLPPLRRIPRSLEEAAAILGASQLRGWWSIKLPLIKPALLAAAVFAFSISMGEFGASTFVARPHLPTMPVAIFRFLGQPGDLNFGQAMAMSAILMLITCCGFWTIGKLDDNEVPSSPATKERS